MKKEKVYTICHNTLDVFNTKEEAKKFYTTCFYSSEGAEQHRYASILVGLNFKNIAYDNVSNSCNEISIKLDKYKDKYLKLKLNDFLSIHDTVELYEKLIKPILEVSDEYDIDFNKKIPFETFGVDNEINMSSFSEYFKDLCSKYLDRVGRDGLKKDYNRGYYGKDYETIKNALKYTLIGFFGSGITPAASGGQPMEIYFMKNDGIPVSKSTLALLIEICAFHIVTISSGIIGAIVNHNLIKDGFIWIFIIGISLNIIAASFLMLGLFSKKLSDWLVKIVIKLLTIFKYKKVAELEKKMLDVLDEYHKGANFIRKNKHIFIKSVIIVFFQVLMYYTVSYFVYRSFGLNNHSYFRIVSISAMLFISISSMPLPGTVGISEGAFLKIYLSIYGIKKLASAMLLNRGINFYLYMIISFVVVVIATLKLKRRTKEN